MNSQMEQNISLNCETSEKEQLTSTEVTETFEINLIHFSFGVVIFICIVPFCYLILRVGSCLTCVYRVMGARRKFEGYERSAADSSLP